MSTCSISAIEVKPGSSITFGNGGKRLLELGHNVIKDPSGRTIESFFISQNSVGFTQTLKNLTATLNKHKALASIGAVSIGAFIAGILWLAKKNHSKESHKGGSFIIYAKQPSAKKQISLIR